GARRRYCNSCIWRSGRAGGEGSRDHGFYLAVCAGHLTDCQGVLTPLWCPPRQLADTLRSVTLELSADRLGLQPDGWGEPQFCYRPTEYFVNAPPAWAIEFGPSAA